MRYGRGKLAGCDELVGGPMLCKRVVTLGKSRTQKTWNGLDQGIGSNKGIVLAGELLDELLVFVQLF